MIYVDDLSVMNGQSLIHTYTVTAKLANYPGSPQVAQASGMIRLVDPCTSPQFTVGATPTV